MKDYAAMFTKPVRRRSEISSLLHSIGSAIIKDVTEAMKLAQVDPKKAIRAAALSFEKYCSVSITLENSVKISYTMTLNSSKIV